MADKDFRIDLILGAKFAEGFRALDDAKKKLENVDKAAGKFSSRAGNAVGTALKATAFAGVAAATAATAVMGLYIAKTIEAEKVQVQLASRIKDTGGIAGRTLEQLNEAAGRLQDLTVFDDEAIGNVQAMLLTFKEIRGVQFDRATASVLDLSTAMGTDLNSAALQLGKALNDPIGGISALSRAGVQFTDDQKKVIKSLVETGQTAKAQELILGELESQMGTAAEAARNTLGGAVQALKNSFDNLLEGDSGDAGIEGTRAAIESLIDTLNDPNTKRGFDAIIGSMVSLTAQTLDGVGAIKRLYDNYNVIRDIAKKDAQGQPLSEREAEVKLQLLTRQKASARARGDQVEVDRLQVQITALIRAGTQRIKNELVTQGVGAAFDFLKQPGESAAPRTSPAAKTPKKTGSKSDPDADIKGRIEDLREEKTLLGQVEEGEEKASAAAKARYDITEGEFKNKSALLKAEYLAAAEALDAKNKDTAAEKKRQEAIEESQEAYAELMRDLRTPAQVAVDDAIAKLNILTEAMKRGEAGGPSLDAAQQKIIDSTFDRAPDLGLGNYNPLDEFERRRQLHEAWYQEQLQRLAQFRLEKADLTAEADRKEEEIEAQHQAALQQLQVAQAQMMLGAASSMFGSLADIARAGAGEQSKAYRVLFAISKGFAIAQAAIALATNVAEASKVGFPQNLPLIAAAFAQGAQIASIIAGANYSGGASYASGGYTGPGGKYQEAGTVHKGEGVLNQEEIAAIGGPSGFYRLRELIDDGAMRDRLFGWTKYADGGFVGGSGPSLTAPDWGSYPQGQAGFTANMQNDMAVHMHLSAEAMFEAAASTPKGRKLILGLVAENGQAIRAAWDN